MSVTYRYYVSGGVPTQQPTYLDDEGNVIGEGKVDPIDEILPDEATYKARVLAFEQDRADRAAVALSAAKAELAASSAARATAAERVRDEAIALGFSAEAAATMAGTDW